VPKRKSMKLKSDVPRLLLLILLVTALWCRLYHRYSLADWKIPTVYSGDAVLVLGWTKASMDGEFAPFGSKMNRHLGAPFVANWNDFPLSEDLLVWWNGLVARVIGLGPALNLSFLSAVVLAAVSFYLVGRYCRWRWEWCLFGAFAFAFSRYGFYRNIPHIALTHYWPIPICLLVCWWVGSNKGLIFSDRRYPFAAGVAAVTGLLSVYYTNFFLQLLLLATLVHVARRSPWPKILAPLSVAGVAVVAFSLTSLDTLIYAFQHGVNYRGVARNFVELDYYALHPVELFIPGVHRWKFLQDWSFHYFTAVAPIHRSNEAVYLGLVGGAGFIAMFFVFARDHMRLSGRPTFAPPWQALWLIAYGMVGGLNIILGLTGFILFRGVNRVSIVLLALSLFFVVRGFSRLSRSWRPAISLALSAALMFFAVIDQIPRRVRGKDLMEERKQYLADRDFVAAMEKKFERGSMIFQLPMVEFPERPPVNHMPDYDSLRPYIFSTGLRFSHGTCKGRSWDSWQRDLETLRPPEMIAALESYGFTAICLERKGYADNGAQIIDAFQRAGRGIAFESSTNELLCIPLQPAARPLLPPLTQLERGWGRVESSDKGTWFSWGKDNAIVTIENPNKESITRHVDFDLRTLAARKVEATSAESVLWSGQVRPEKLVFVRDLPLILPPGKTELRFVTAAPVDDASKADPLHALALINFRLK
jgi:hypothetical protein